MPNDENDRGVVIDSHCHTFNAKDLPVYGFVERVVLNADEEVLPEVLMILTKMLSKAVKYAPDADNELRKIAELLGEPYGDDVYKEGVLEAVADREDEGGPDDDEFLETLRTVIEDIETSKDKEEQDLLEALEKEAGIEKRDEALEAFPIDLAKALWDKGGVAARYLKWIKLLFQYRFEITERLIDTYAKDGESVDLFTPALIDYDLWVDDEADTKLFQQMKLMEGNIRLQKGRIHPFFPVDPWRQACSTESGETPLTLLKQAVERYGFIGAKLYPPMGYSAIGNAAHISFPPHAPQPPQAFGADLDEALHALYAYCEVEDIPILTHCADSNEVQDTFGERAAPGYWRRVIEDYPSLRVNLGHFGDLDTLENTLAPGGWAWQVGELLDDPSTHVYADISHHNPILDDEGRERTIRNLEQLFISYPNAKDRILFGTDWIMLARVKDHDRFLIEFRDAYAKKFGDSEVKKFMGKNAAEFMGLHVEDKTRQRLDRFYTRHSIPKPSWAKAVDGG